MLLTACEKGLVDDGSVGADAGQVTNTVLQVRTRAGGGTGGDGPTVAYPVQVYVLQGDECRAVQTIGDDGIYDIYTLPHTEDDVLTKLTVTALDANDNTVKERIFENVPVTRNQVTRYTGSFFGSGGGGGSSSDGTFRLTADPDWDSVNGYTF